MQIKLLIISILSFTLSACDKDDKSDPMIPAIDRNAEITYDVPSVYPYPAVPDNNRPTLNRIALGQRLFNDVILSQNNSISCSSCHRDNHAFIDGFRVSTGINNHVGTRNAITALNSAYLPALLWDGKFTSVEDQAIGPIENPLEMGSDVNVALAKLQNKPDYVAQFQEAYGEGPTLSTLKRALACFERTLYTAPSKYDYNTLNPSEANGKDLFFGKANCFNCHNSPAGMQMFSNFTYQNTGRFISYADSGRYLITQIQSDIAKFRVPPLRGIVMTAPYMHDGRLNTLEEVVDFYNGGGVSHPNKNPIIQPLNLTPQEKTDLVNFLKAI